MFGLQTANGNTLKDAIIIWKEYTQSDEKSVLDVNSFNSLAHSGKISAILNCTWLKLKRSDTQTPTNSNPTQHIFNKIKWNISYKEFNKNCNILTIELIPEYNTKL